MVDGQGTVGGGKCVGDAESKLLKNEGSRLRANNSISTRFIPRGRNQRIPSFSRICLSFSHSLAALFVSRTLFSLFFFFFFFATLDYTVDCEFKNKSHIHAKILASMWNPFNLFSAVMCNTHILNIEMQRDVSMIYLIFKFFLENFVVSERR